MRFVTLEEADKEDQRPLRFVTLEEADAEDAARPTQADVRRAEPPEPAAAREPRRGTLRGVTPYSAPAGYAGRGSVNPPLAEDYGQRDAAGFPVAPEQAQRMRVEGGAFNADRVNAGQAGSDVAAGVLGVMAAGQGVKGFFASNAAELQAARLKAMDAIDRGEDPGPVPGLPTYATADPARRERIRASALKAVAEDRGAAAAAAGMVEQYKKEAAGLTGKVPDFTDIQGWQDFGVWLARNAAIGSPSLAVSMISAMGGPLLAVPTISAQALGGAAGDRLSAAQQATDPKRFGTADRQAQALDERGQRIAEYGARNAVPTLARTVVDASADLLLGPVARALRRWVRVPGGVDEKTLGEVIKGAPKEAFKDIAEELVAGGVQSATEIATAMAAGERGSEWTREDMLQIINGATAEAAGAPLGTAMNVAGRAGAVARDNAVLRSAAEGGDVAAAVELASRRGELRKPVLLQDVPTKVMSPEQIAAIPADPKPPEADTVKPAAAPSPYPARLPAVAGRAAAAPIGVAAMPQGSIAAAAYPQAPAATNPPAQPATPAAAPPAAPLEAIQTEADPVAVAPPADALAQGFPTDAAVVEWAATNGMADRVVPVQTPEGWTPAPVVAPLTPEAVAKQDTHLAAFKAKMRADGQLIGGDFGAAAAASADKITVVPDEDMAGTPLGAVIRAVRAAFGYDVTLVRGMKAAGAAWGGRAYVNVTNKSKDEGLIFLIGHEVQHLLDLGKSPTEKAAAKALRQVVLTHLRGGAAAIEARRVEESKDLALERTSAYAENEIAADLNGALWSDPEFWGRLYDVDNGSLFRQVLYRFMQASTKALTILKGSKGYAPRMRVETYVTSVEAVREAAAQAWAARAKQANKPATKVNKLPPKPKAAPALARRQPDDDLGDVEPPARARTGPRQAPTPKIRLESPDQYRGPSLADMDKAELQRELDAELAGSGWKADLKEELRSKGAMSPKRAAEPAEGPSLQDVGDADIRAAGLMAEDAYPPLNFKPRPADDVLQASVKFDAGRVGAVWLTDLGGRYQAQGASSWMRALANAGKGLPEALQRGNALGGLTLSEPRAREWAQRFTAAGDLYRRGYDLLDGVTPEQATRVREGWETIIELPRAFTYPDPYVTSGKPVDRLNEIAESMLEGSGWTMTAEWALPGEVRASNVDQISLELTSPKGMLYEPYLEYRKRSASRGGPEVVIHAAGLDKASGGGKPLYQVVAAWADQIGGEVVADEAGLTPVNAYRRTEQQASANLRSRGMVRLLPGIAQRIYGWDVAPRTADARASNTVRLMLAQARNVAEFYPAIEGMSYDIEADTFAFSDGQDATPFIDAILADPDLREASISRSSLARAALTFSMLQGRLRVNDSMEVAAPVLYSVGDVSAAPEQDAGDTYSAFDGKPVSYQVRVADTGEIATVTVDGGRALRELNDRRTTMRKLLECIG